MTIRFGPESMVKQIYEKSQHSQTPIESNRRFIPFTLPSKTLFRALLHFAKHLRINAFLENPLHFLHIFGLLFFLSTNGSVSCDC